MDYPEQYINRVINCMCVVAPIPKVKYQGRKKLMGKVGNITEVYISRGCQYALLNLPRTTPMTEALELSEHYCAITPLSLVDKEPNNIHAGESYKETPDDERDSVWFEEDKLLFDAPACQPTPLRRITI